MKRVFVLTIAFCSFIAFFLLPDNVSALTLPNPNRSCVTDVGDNRNCSSPGVSSASWWDQAFFESTYHLGDFGSGGNIYKSIQFEWDTIGLCTGQTILVKGTIGGLTGFFKNGYDIQVWNNSAQMTCSLQQVDTSRVNFTCSGIGGGALWVYVNQTSFTPGTVYQIGLSKNLDVTCSASSSDVIINQNQNTENIINNQNQNTQQIIQGQEDIKDSITDDTVDTGSAGGFFEDFEDNDHGLSDIITLPLNFIKSLTSNTCSPLSVPLPFVNQNLSLPCMSEIYSQYFGAFFSIYQAVTTGLIGYWVAVRIFGLVKGFKDPEDDKIEVMDL